MTWKVATLGQLMASEGGLVQTGPFGSQLKQSEYTAEGTPVVMPTDIIDGSVDTTDIARVPETKVDALFRHKLRKDTIVLPRRGAITKRAYVTENEEGWLCGTGCLKIEPMGQVIWPRYLYHFMGTAASIDWLERNAVGSTMANLSAEIVNRFPVSYPNIEVQKRIASFLENYDSLIANNKRRIELLEQSARLLFKEWFVHLRYPGHEHDKTIDGAPPGWSMKPLEEIADFRLGKMLDQNKNKGELRPYLANVNVRWGKIELHDLREMRFEESELETFGLQHGDIVMCEGGEPGRCAMWKDQLPGMMIQKAIHRIRAHPETDQLYLYYSLRYLGESGRLAMLFTGSTIKHLPREKLALVKVCIPQQRLASAFAELVAPIERQIAALEAANRSAAKARDLLLPRLMNGSISV